jgi:hypothetical protein
MWNAIQYVSSGVSLVAFISAIGGWIYLKIKLKEIVQRENLIKNTPDSERASLIADTLSIFHVKTEYLSKKQQYELAIKQINAHQVNIRRKQLGVIIISVLIIVACSIIILQPIELDKLSSNNTQISNLAKPDFHCDIRRISLVDEPKEIDCASLVFYLEISNAGDQSIVKDWSSYILLNTGTKVNGQLQATDIIISENEDSTQGKKIATQDLLFNKTIYQPIQKGGLISGFLLVRYPGVQEKDIMIDNTVFTIKFKDVIGKEYSSSLNWNSKTIAPWSKAPKFPGEF